MLLVLHHEYLSVTTESGKYTVTTLQKRQAVISHYTLQDVMKCLCYVIQTY